MTGIERLREWAKEARETARACRDGEIGYVLLDVEAYQLQKAAKLEAIADQIEREIDEAANKAVDALSAREMHGNARWHSAIVEGAESDCKAEFELISRYWLPRPRFEDGKPVDVGSYIGEINGTDYGLTGEPVKRFEISAVHDSPGGEWVIRLEPGQVVKRPEPEDSWERLEADVKMGMCEYFGCQRFGCYDGEDCPAHDAESCFAHAYLDLVRRCKALAGVE